MLRELIKNTGIYFLTNLLSQVAVFIFWIVAANILDPSEIGVYALVIFVTTFFAAFATFGLDNSIDRFYYSDEKTEEVFCNALIIFFFSAIISMIVLFLSSGFIARVIPNIHIILSKNIVSLYFLVITSSLYNLALVHYSALRRATSYAKISLSQTLIFFILSLLFLFLNFKILGVFYALIISYFFPASIFLLKEIRISRLPGIFSVRIIKSMINYGLPMMLYSVLGVVVVYIGRIFLDKYTTLSILGVYSFFLTITMQVNALWGTFNRAWTPKVFSMLKEDKKNALMQIKTIAFLSSFFYLLFFATFIILVKIGVLSLFLKPVYLSNVGILYILLAGPLFTGVYTAVFPLFYYQKNTRPILLVSVALNIVNIIITFFMVRAFGETGAALSYFFSSIISLLFYLVVFTKIMDIPAEIIKWFVIFACLMLFGTALFLMTSSDILLLLFIVFGMFISYRMGELDKKKYLLNKNLFYGEKN